MKYWPERMSEGIFFNINTDSIKKLTFCRMIWRENCDLLEKFLVNSISWNAGEGIPIGHGFGTKMSELILQFIKVKF